jgi:hypothetical protein
MYGEVRSASGFAVTEHAACSVKHLTLEFPCSSSLPGAKTNKENLENIEVLKRFGV